MRTAWLAMIGGLALVGATAAIAMAQGPPPVVAVTASPSAATVTATGPLPAGPTTLRITRPASKTGLSVYVALLVPGVTVQDLQAAFAADDRNRNDSSLGLASIQASVSLEGTTTTHDVTLTLKPGLTYVVVTQPQTDGAPPSRGFTTFTTSATANGAVAPAPDATIRMVGLSFRGNATLPRKGTIRVQNDSGVPHIAVAFPLRRGVTPSRLGRALRSDDERAFGALVAGDPTFVHDGISGSAADQQQVTFSKAGRYGLICFLGQHNKLGMYRVVNVR